MYIGESICKATYKYPQSFSKEEERMEETIFACAQLKMLSETSLEVPNMKFYYLCIAENREIKAPCSFEDLLHQANADFAYLSNAAWKSVCLTYKSETHRKKMKKTLRGKIN